MDIVCNIGTLLKSLKSTGREYDEECWKHYIDAARNFIVKGLTLEDPLLLDVFDIYQPLFSDDDLRYMLEQVLDALGKSQFAQNVTLLNCILSSPQIPIEQESLERIVDVARRDISSLPVQQALLDILRKCLETITCPLKLFSCMDEAFIKSLLSSSNFNIYMAEIVAILCGMDSAHREATVEWIEKEDIEDMGLVELATVLDGLICGYSFKSTEASSSSFHSTCRKSTRKVIKDLALSLHSRQGLFESIFSLDSERSDRIISVLKSTTVLLGSKVNVPIQFWSSKLDTLDKSGLFIVCSKLNSCFGMASCIENGESLVYGTFSFLVKSFGIIKKLPNELKDCSFVKEPLNLEISKLIKNFEEYVAREYAIPRKDLPVETKELAQRFIISALKYRLLDHNSMSLLKSILTLSHEVKLG